MLSSHRSWHNAIAQLHATSCPTAWILFGSPRVFSCMGLVLKTEQMLIDFHALRCAALLQVSVVRP
jgi:hypothetical protein